MTSPLGRRLGRNLQEMLTGPDGLNRHARPVAHDNAGRTYRAAIPLRTAIGLRVTGAAAHVFDENGKQMRPITFTARRR